MSETLKLRWRFVLLGTLAGLVVWGLIEMPKGGALQGKLIAAAVFASFGFFTTLLLMTGRTGGRRALGAASGVGLLGFGAMLMLGRRFAQTPDVFSGFGHSMALLAVALLPLPYLIAAAGPGWRHYPTLFEESWSAAIRAGLAWIFVGIVWLLILVATALLDTVGLDALGRLVAQEGMVFAISGTSLGLGLAVVSEAQNRIPSRLVVRLLRLLTPGVLAVAVLFVLALGLRGFKVNEGWSAGQIILTLTGLAIGLVTLVADTARGTASDSRVLVVSARGLAGLVPVLAGLALWVVAARVGQYGWMPDRLFAALLAGLGLVYGAVYAAAALRAGDWMARVRAANPWLMLGVLAAAILWLSPVLNAERISASSQTARLLAAEDPSTAVTYWQMRDLGLAGQAALDRVAAVGAAEGREDLVAWATGEAGEVAGDDTTALQGEVAGVLPLIPASATGTRDVVLAAMRRDELDDVLRACQDPVPGGGWGCVLVVADLIPAVPGEEAVLGLWRGGRPTLEGLVPTGDGLMRAPMRSLEGRALTAAEAEAVMRAWQAAPPAVAPAGLNQLGVGAAGLVFVP